MQLIHRASGIVQQALDTILRMDDKQMRALSRKCPLLCTKVYESIQAKSDKISATTIAFINDVIDAQADYVRFGSDEPPSGDLKLIELV